MLRSTLLAAASRPRLRRWLEAAPGGRAVVARFVAGHDAAAVVRVAEELAADRLRVTIDHLGEDITDPSHAARTVEEYVKLIDSFREASVAGRPDVSIKLSALGQALPADGDAVAYGNAVQVCTAAERAGATVTLDMEDHTTTDSTLAILGRLRVDFPSVGVAVQARLRRTEEDCVRLAETGSRVRLCKGAYAEPPEVAFQQRTEVDQSFRRCMEILFGGPGYPMIASHDPAMIGYAQALAERHGRAAGDHEFQMLYGVRPAEQRRLAAGGHTVRVYLPYGVDSTAYFLRRLAERPANVVFFLRSLTGRR
ncbi:proline dehydrogenase family protein [Micromonospora sonneratiae]|uniref:proline dehydrogenase n=1 Tax=Micromonospora sonneratiae TaxID=1184706 RepID=A0ABW3Y7E9_9ACTN